MQHAPITTPITDKLASMTWIRWFRQLVDRVDEIKGTADAPAWDSITGKPDEFPPEPHTHTPSVKIFTQATPAATWGPFAHLYGRPVSVETIDSLGNEFDAGVVQNHPDYTTVTVTLGAATTGRVIIH